MSEISLSSRLPKLSRANVIPGLLNLRAGERTNQRIADVPLHFSTSLSRYPLTCNAFPTL
ncbi:hypothetical protein WG66_005391 [Moniliophthora roreri]|nr:hypothetical protein WG66_005391 [Moniliophthora roreri]